MKPTKKIIKALEKAGCSVKLFDTYTLITYYTNHDGEEFVEIPFKDDLCKYLCDYYQDYDVSYETSLWFDNEDHGKSGAPHDMRDVLADKEEWEAKLEELAMIAAKYAA